MVQYERIGAFIIVDYGDFYKIVEVCWNTPLFDLGFKLYHISSRYYFYDQILNIKINISRILSEKDFSEITIIPELPNDDILISPFECKDNLKEFLQQNKLRYKKRIYLIKDGNAFYNFYKMDSAIANGDIDEFKLNITKIENEKFIPINIDVINYLNAHINENSNLRYIL